jgi:hypothetical protein
LQYKDIASFFGLILILRSENFLKLFPIALFLQQNLIQRHFADLNQLIDLQKFIAYNNQTNAKEKPRLELQSINLNLEGKNLTFVFLKAQILMQNNNLIPRLYNFNERCRFRSF